jgi:hypothetical protein
MKTNHVFHITLLAALIILTSMPGCKTSSLSSIVLENDRLSLEIGTNDGAIKSIHDKSLDVHYNLNGVAIE